MKTNASPALLAALFVSALALPSAAFAFAEIERGALTLTTTGRIAHDSNLAGNASDLSDTIYTLAPTLNYTRAAGLGTIDASLGVALNRYADLSAFDSDDLSASLHVSLPTPEGAREQGGFSAAYSDRSSIDETIGQRVRAKTWTAGFNESFRAGPRTDLTANFGYSDVTRGQPIGGIVAPPSDVTSGNSRDRTQWSAGLGFNYTDFLGGAGLEGNYRYSDTQSSASTLGAPSINQSSHSVSTGLFYRLVSGLRISTDVGYRWLDRGAAETASGRTSSNGMTFSLKFDGPFLPPRLFPKVKSSFSIGYEKGESIGLNSNGSGTLVGNLDLAWQARERTAFTFGASRSQGLSSANLSSVNSNVQFGVTQQIGDRTSLSANLGQEWSVFPGTGRSDRRTRGGAKLAYSVNRHWQAGADYTLTLSRSSYSFHDYDRHVLGAYVSCTF